MVVAKYKGLRLSHVFGVGAVVSAAIGSANKKSDGMFAAILLGWLAIATKTLELSRGERE